MASPPAVTHNLQFTDFTVNANLKVPSGTVIRATGTVTINAALSVDFGASSGAGPKHTIGTGLVLAGMTPAQQGVALSPASSGEYGDNANTRAGGPGGLGLQELQARQLLHPGPLAGGAGANALATKVTGSRGGGSITILARGPIVVTATGIINADARPFGVLIAGSGGGGGGAGGVIILASKTSVTNSGSLSAQGADGCPSGTNDGPGGGGSGGIAHLLSPTAPVTGAVTLTGGQPGTVGGAFTGTERAGGGGGGACASGGGTGGSAGVSNPVAGTAGGPGKILASQVDPTSLF